MPSNTSEPTPEQKAAEIETYKKNTALACFILCPTLALLPPRKLDFYTFSLTGVWVVSANHLTYTYTGRSAWQRIAYRPPNTSASSPESLLKQSGRERYEEVQRQLREQGIKGAEKGKDRGVLEKVWMGDEKEGWKERRMREEREALERGEGYGSLMARHFREAFGAGDKDEKSKEEKK